MPSTTIRRAKNGGPISYSQIANGSEFNHDDAKAAEMEENGTFGDDEEEQEGEDDEEEVEAAIARAEEPIEPKRGRGRPPKVRDALAAKYGVPSSALKAEQTRVHDDFEQLVGELDFTDSKHKINVSRTWPDKTADGQACAGFLRTYENKVSLADIQNTFGGGTFVIQVRGPGPLGRGSVIKTTKTIPIPGEPIVPRIHNPRIEEEKAASSVASVVQQALATQAREQERLHQKLAETERRLFDVLAKKDGDMGTFFPTLLEKMQEERKLDELRRLEERRIEEERRREEREAAKEERAAVERRFQMELQERRIAHEKEMALIESRRKDETQSNTQSTNMLLEFFRAKEASEKELRSEQKEQSDKMSEVYMNMMQQGSKQSVEMLMSTMATTNQMMMQALNNKKGGIGEFAEQIVAMKEAMRVLNGEEDEEPESMGDKVLKRLDGVIPMVTQIAAARFGGPAPQPQPQRLPTAMVDLGPAPRALARPNPSPPPHQTQQHQPIEAETSETSEEENEDMQGSEEETNDFTEFVFPKDADTQKVAIPSLVKNIDLAIQRDMTAEQIRTEIVPFFEQNYRFAMMFIKGMSANELVEFLVERTPASWAVVSPRGTEVLRELHALLKK